MVLITANDNHRGQKETLTRGVNFYYFPRGKHLTGEMDPGSCLLNFSCSEDLIKTGTWERQTLRLLSLHKLLSLDSGLMERTRFSLQFQAPPFSPLLSATDRNTATFAARMKGQWKAVHTSFSNQLCQIFMIQWVGPSSKGG